MIYIILIIFFRNVRPRLSCEALPSIIVGALYTFLIFDSDLIKQDEFNPLTPTVAMTLCARPGLSHMATVGVKRL